MNELQLSQIQLTAPHKQNLTRAERQALHELTNNTDIVIKPADKGSAVVVMDRSDYIAEGLRQLSDKEFYLPVDECLTSRHNKMIKDKIDQMLKDNEISSCTAEYLHVQDPLTLQLYLLPKIHKGIVPLPGRPIILANECPTERISQLVDHFLQPHIPQIKSWVKDSGHCINILSKLPKLKLGGMLSSLDVVSLYTKMSQRDCIATARKFLIENRCDGENPSNESLIELFTFVLECNSFQFNDQNYLQIGGTAMGTR